MVPHQLGTRDAFNELAIENGCKTFPERKALKKNDKKLYKSQCRAIREDGAYVEAGENDNLIIEKLVADPSAIGVFGYSFLDQNKDKVKAAKVNNVLPEFEAISSGEYPVSRSLFFYVKMLMHQLFLELNNTLESSHHQRLLDQMDI